MAPRTAAALVIGNELLSGKIRDENLFELACLLRRLGIRLSRVVMVQDDIDTISAEVLSLSSTHDLLFTSGGVGPTHDDVTIEAVSKAFAVSVIVHPDLAEIIRSHYRERTTEGHVRMAMVPEGAVLHATAEVPWPAIAMRNVFVLPGVPEAFKMKLSIIERVLGADRPFITRSVYSNLDEGILKPMLDAVVALHPRVEVGSYPTWRDLGYRTKLTFDGLDETDVESALRELLTMLPEGEPLRVD